MKKYILGFIILTTLSLSWSLKGQTIETFTKVYNLIEYNINPYKD
jgi:hypothetical protein